MEKKDDEPPSGFGDFFLSSSFYLLNGKSKIYHVNKFPNLLKGGFMKMDGEDEE